MTCHRSLVRLDHSLISGSSVAAMIWLINCDKVDVAWHQIRTVMSYIFFYLVLKSVIKQPVVVIDDYIWCWQLTDRICHWHIEHGNLFLAPFTSDQGMSRFELVCWLASPLNFVMGSFKPWLNIGRLFAWIIVAKLFINHKEKGMVSILFITGW